MMVRAILGVEVGLRAEPILGKELGIMVGAILGLEVGLRAGSALGKELIKDVGATLGSNFGLGWIVEITAGAFVGTGAT